MDYWRNNNFDLIRVLASAQVAIVHVIYWFDLEVTLLPVNRVLQVFPGVPVFFFISGLLISHSFLNTTARQYLRNRCLRIFPALWICLVVMLAPILLNAGCAAPSSSTGWLSWWFAQMSIGQMWTPEFLRGCWQNAFNGGRWTIAVELEFYLLLPLIMLLLRKTGRGADIALGALAVASLAVQLRIQDALHAASPTWLMVLYGSLLPYLWIFILGMLARRHIDRVRGWCAHKVLWWAIAYVMTVLTARALGLKLGGSAINPLSMVVLCGLVLSFAFSWPGLSDRVLRRNDFTYGLYLFHPVVLLLMSTFGLGAGLVNGALALLVSFALAVASWFLVERPFLRRKHDAVYRHEPLATTGIAGAALAPAVSQTNGYPPR